jgi:hypothetical protein
MPAFCTLWLLLLLAIIFGCANTTMENKREDKVSALVFFWQDAALCLIKKYQLNPLLAARQRVESDLINAQRGLKC